MMDAAHSPAVGTGLRVLQLGKYFYPDAGGVETVTLDISKGLLANGLSADVLCVSKTDVEIPAPIPISVYRCRSDLEIAGKSVSLQYVRQVRALQADYDVGLIHLPNPLAMMAVNLFWRKPIVLLWHADIVGFPRARALLQHQERSLIKRAARIISPTPAHVGGSYLAAEMKPKSVDGAYPFDADRLTQADGPGSIADEVMGFMGARRMILAVGRLVPYKGFDVLIRAARQIDARAAVCIVGVGPLESDLRQMISTEGLGDRVMLAGRADDSGLRRLYQKAHVVTMPSVTRAEMYGMTQVEAMSFGCPLVSTSIPQSGVSWVNQHDVTGLIVEPSSPDALAGALNRMVQDDALHSRLAHGAKTVFSAQHSLKAAAAHYGRILTEAAATVSRNTPQ
jgi:glycosyltransferase involved in cell wall biosynthesis